MRAFGVILLAFLAVVVSAVVSKSMRMAQADEIQTTNNALLPVVPEKWHLAYSEEPGGPEGRKAPTTKVELNQDGELTRITYRAIAPQNQTKTEELLPVKERNDYLLQFGRLLESFSFEPAMGGWFDTDTVSFSLQAGRRTMEVEVNDFRGETNLEFRSRVIKLLPKQERSNLKQRVQPSADKRLGGVADPWEIEVTISIGSTRAYRINVESEAMRKLIETRRGTSARDLSMPCQLTLQEYVPGAKPVVANHTIDLSWEVEQVSLDRALYALKAFAFPEKAEAAAGNIEVLLKLVSTCASGETTRRLTITESGLTPAQLEKSIAAEWIRMVNGKVPENRRIRWD